MTDVAAIGTVRTAIDGHVLRIEVDNVAKKNAITPDMMSQLSDAPDDLRKRRWPLGRRPGSGRRAHDRGPGHGEVLRPHRHGEADPEDQVDPFALYRRTTKPVISVVQASPTRSASR